MYYLFYISCKALNNISGLFLRRFLPDSLKDNAYEVIRFVEKPNIELAKEYVNSGEYLWNSGMFIWKTSSILNNMEKYILVI